MIVECHLRNGMTKNMNLKLLTALVLPAACLLAFTGCSSLNGTANNGTAVPDRTSLYLDGNAPD